MRALIVEELAIDVRELVECHVAKLYTNDHLAPFHDSLQRSHLTVHDGNSMSAVLRLSAGLGHSRLSNFGSIPGHKITQTSVRFLGIVRKNNHCTYKLHVDTGGEHFTLQKRYSQFRDLRQHLLLNRKVVGSKKRNGQCPNGACRQLTQQLVSLKFPRRKLKFQLHRDDDVKTARERQTQLQNFVELVLAAYRTAPKRRVRCCVNSQCCVLKAIRSFFDIKDLDEEELSD